ncbi:MAG: hypothetical protein QOI57_286, partial [Rubrobacteraceae bacterium]|nr:hypothetical protein [Rubrobacteraceae bacterium]
MPKPRWRPGPKPAATTFLPYYYCFFWSVFSSCFWSYFWSFFWSFFWSPPPPPQAPDRITISDNKHAPSAASSAQLYLTKPLPFLIVAP